MKNSFNDQVKNEIISSDYDQKQFLIILTFYLQDNFCLHYDPVKKVPFMEIHCYQPKILVFMQKYFKAYCGFESFLLPPPKKHRLNKLLIYDPKGYEFLNTIHLQQDDHLKTKEDVQPILIGIFLASGVICNVHKKIYHAEISFKALSDAKKIFQLLKSLRINTKIYQYHNKVKIYIKRVEAISDFLKLINAPESMMDLEEIRISNDYINQNQRLNNLDLANISKVTKAALSQTKIIQELQTTDLLNDLDNKTQYYIEIRLKNPEASLSDLAIIFEKEYHLPISKSGINHIVRKLKSLHKSAFQE